MKAVFTLTLLELGCRRCTVLRLAVCSKLRSGWKGRSGDPVLLVCRNGTGTLHFGSDKVHTSHTKVSVRLSASLVALMVWVALGSDSTRACAWATPEWPLLNVAEAAAQTHGAVIFPSYATTGPSFHQAGLGLNISDHDLRGVHRAVLQQSEVSHGLCSTAAAAIRDTTALRSANHGKSTESSSYMDRSLAELRLDLGTCYSPHPMAALTGIASPVCVASTKKTLRYLQCPRISRPRQAWLGQLRRDSAETAPPASSGRGTTPIQSLTPEESASILELKDQVSVRSVPASKLLAACSQQLLPSAKKFVRKLSRHRGRATYLRSLWSSSQESAQDTMQLVLQKSSSSLPHALAAMFLALGCPPLRYCAALTPSCVHVHGCGVVCVQSISAFVIDGLCPELRLSPQMGAVLLSAWDCVLQHTNSTRVSQQAMSASVRSQFGCEGVIAVRFAILRWAAAVDSTYLQHMCLANGWVGGKLSQALETAGCYL